MFGGVHTPAVGLTTHLAYWNGLMNPFASTDDVAELKWATPLLILAVLATAVDLCISALQVFAATELVLMTLAPTTPAATCAPVMVTRPATVGRTGFVPGPVAASTPIESMACVPPERVTNPFPSTANWVLLKEARPTLVIFVDAIAEAT